jgi:hypothetical protein
LVAMTSLMNVCVRNIQWVWNQTWIDRNEDFQTIADHRNSENGQGAFLLDSKGLGFPMDHCAEEMEMHQVTRNRISQNPLGNRQPRGLPAILEELFIHWLKWYSFCFIFHIRRAKLESNGRWTPWSSMV